MIFFSIFSLHLLSILNFNFYIDTRYMKNYIITITKLRYLKTLDWMKDKRRKKNELLKSKMH